MKILLITGGDSSERTVSLKSAKNVKEALEENGHTVKLYDLLSGYDSIQSLADQYDALFPVLHGEEGEGGKLHKFLSKINKPIVGTRNYKALELAWPKIPFKKYCDENNIPTPKWKIVKSKEDIRNFGFPCVLKTSNGGSSKEVAILRTAENLNDPETALILKVINQTFVEDYLKGVEITVGILNNKALPIIEIIPPAGEFFTYENKYSLRTQEIPFAPSLDKNLQKEIQKLTLKIHKHFNLGSYSRTDYIVYDGVAYANELNTIPGLTPGSLMPKAAEAAGIKFNEFLEILLKSAK